MLNRIARHALALSLALSLAFSLTACSINPVTAKGELKQEVADAKSIFVSNENGSVQLIRDPDATAMQISAEIRCSGQTEAKAADRVKATRLVATRDEGGKVRIGVEFPPVDPATTVPGLGEFTVSNDSASIIVRAASLDGIEVINSNGSIAVGAFAGTAKLETTNGSIAITDHAGPVDARSSNGSIRASGAHAPFTAETSNGRIEVSLAADAQGDIDLDTSNGSVTLELGGAWQGTVTADTSNGKIEMSGGTAEGKSDRRTMTVGDPERAKASIDTSNGRVTVRAAK